MLAWSLMGIGELVGMRWILWNGDDEMPEAVFDELARIIVRTLGAGTSTREHRDRGNRDLPTRELDERGRGLGGELHPRAGDPPEVRVAREAHRRSGRARQ